MMQYEREEILPSKWYNVIPDLPEPLAPPKSESSDSSSIELLNRIIPKEVLRQEFTFNRFENIPDEIREKYLLVGRPTPLIRAKGLENFLDYHGKIFLKYEGATVTGSHKINTAIPQVYYAHQEGVKEVVTETGAGQWGTATALASSLYGMKSKVFMVRVSYMQKQLRRTIMNVYGADVSPSPSRETKFGSTILDRDPDSPGSLGIGISEAVEYALDKGIKYMLGSVMNSVITHQSVIGLETRRQMELIGEFPDVMIGCVGGGSNFSGFTFPFIDKVADIEMVASTATEVAKFRDGEYKYDFIDSAGILPQLRMYSLGANFIPEKIYAGGLRYHGAAPALSMLVKNGMIRHDEVSEDEVINALRIFSRTQGIIAAPESGHAIASAIKYIEKDRSSKKTVVINVSGHGLLDLSIFTKGGV
ncbi:MAG: TrpB-like pyridoxal phosphate-dependent enzyme [Thermoplasmata archaeon]